MEFVTGIDDTRRLTASWRRAGKTIALVPTMGNLHAGHLALCKVASQLAQRTLVSLFVNPMQFGPGEDYEHYPRTLDADRQVLHQIGVDALFAPAVEVIYPRGVPAHTTVEVPGLSGVLCGATRPGHFTGVATVVCRLLHLVGPDSAVFGKKDYQQLLIIRRMVEDLAIPVQVHGVATQRAPDGLALSSRNAYLRPEERAIAPQLYATLQVVAETLRRGTAAEDAETQGELRLRAYGFEPEYLRVRRSDDLGAPRWGDRELVILAAARLGSARLIDNLELSLPPAPSA